MAGKPVIALDIDGTTARYHEHFTRFAERWVGRPMPNPGTMTPDVPFFKHLGMSKAKYRECKIAFRHGGLKRDMPVYPGVADMVRSFRKAGAEVWFCTTRAYLSLDNIEPDTREWLRRNGIQRDGLLFGTYKYNDLVRNVGQDRVLAVLDDLPEQCYAARRLGLQAYLKNQPYNQGNSDFPRVRNFTDDPWAYTMFNYIQERVQTCKERG